MSDSEVLKQMVDNMVSVMTRIRNLEARECLGTAICGVPVDCSKAPDEGDMWVYQSGVWNHVLNISPDSVTIEAFLVLSSDAATIDAAGAIIATASHMVVDTFGGAAADNLDDINGVTAVGTLLIVRSDNSARDPTLRDGVGNLVLAGAADFTLTNARDAILLMYTGLGWLELSRSDNR